MREQTDNVIHASPAATTTYLRPANAFRYGMITAIIAAVFMAVTGALGTDAAPFGTRIAFWGIVMVSGHMIGTGVTSGIRGWGKLSANPWTEGALISFVIAAPITVLVSGASAIFFGYNEATVSGLLIMFAVVAFVSAIMTAINMMIGKDVANEVKANPQPTETNAPIAARIRSRLPVHLQQAAIWAIEAEDHYLRVHTDLGSDLILMRLSDAIAETEGLNGAQTHRSWWVASGAITRIERGDGRAILHLHGGITAPVSRTYVRKLTASGWLKSHV